MAKNRFPHCNNQVELALIKSELYECVKLNDECLIQDKSEVKDNSIKQLLDKDYSQRE